MGKWHHAIGLADDCLAERNFATPRQGVAHLALKMRDPNDFCRLALLSREDMGAILNLQQETVSRELRTLVRQDVLRQCDTQARVFRVHILDALQGAAAEK